jgi:ABC-type sugar transport system permease subunit
VNSNSNRISLVSYVVSIISVSLLVFGGLLLITHLLKDGLIPLASAVGAIIVFAALVFLQKRFTPYRWLFISLVFVLIFTIYPIISTVLISFSNMSGGHLITKEQAINRLESKVFMQAGSAQYQWTAYVKGENSYLLLLQDSNNKYFKAAPGKNLVEISESDITKQFSGYSKMLKKDVVPIIEKLGSLVFYKNKNEVRIQSLQQASELQSLYTYNSSEDSMTDNETGSVFFPVKGTFTSLSGDTLIPGFKVDIGLTNYSRFIKNPGYRAPIGNIIIWNISFAFFSVTLSFFLGLLIALAFDKLPGRKIIRTLLIIPYPIPVLVSITVWKGLLNESMGLITNVLQNLFGTSPQFFSDRFWARVALVLINIYLSYPYFYILASGALRSIPGDLFEAADIDGATTLVKLKMITLPLLLKILAPLLIASFSFNFNNFTLIWGFNAGLPAMANTIVPMGYTDLLISFVYRLGFSTANASNYGFAAAITVILFFFVSAMVFLQIRSTRALQEDR